MNIRLVHSNTVVFLEVTSRFIVRGTSADLRGGSPLDWAGGLLLGTVTSTLLPSSSFLEHTMKPICPLHHSWQSEAPL